MNLFQSGKNRTLETFFFFLLLLAGIVPLVAHTYFVTLDGPAHLYSGVIIKHLLKGDTPLINDLFQLNRIPVPNWSGHFLFAWFSTFLPAYLTEKVVIFLYLFFTPLVFRMLILHLAPENRIFSWLMIFFVHNHNFYFGFFNLSFGILFLFLTILYFYKYCNRVGLKQIIILALLFLATWFSHLMPFMISLTVIIVISLGKVVRTYRQGELVLSGFREIFLNTLKIILAALPALILTVIYMARIDSVQDAPRPDLKQLFEGIVIARPLLALGDGFPWRSYTMLFFLLFVVMLATHTIKWLKKATRRSGNEFLFSGFPEVTPLIWFLFTLGFLLLYLLLPNAILLTGRLILLFYLFLITWLALLKYPKWIHLTALVVFLLFHTVFTRMYYRTMGDLSGEIVLMKEAVREVEPGSLILTLNYKDNWLHAHTSGYAGADQPVVVLENYEAGLAWFPVIWNSDHYKTGFLNDWGIDNKKVACDKYIHRDDPGIFALTTHDDQIKPVDYVLLACPPAQIDSRVDSCQLEILRSRYTLRQQNNFCSLYALNR